ncbi:TPA_exp: hypothetical protein A8136_5676 [Trichophyton benhamiae CBS 112371]|nr:TPA_exp: hypothetical protein A8136_5676 [Trichophyton benhamiae CBS 112371]
MTETGAMETVVCGTIVVEKLTKNVNENHLREIFSAYGEIESLELPMNRQFMTNRGAAYIHYRDPADAESAIAHMHEAQLDGAVLSVSIILPRRTFSRSPPPATRPSRAEYGGGRLTIPFPRRASKVTFIFLEVSISYTSTPETFEKR